MDKLFVLSVYAWIFNFNDRVNGFSIFPDGGINGSNLFECGQSASFNCLAPEALFNVVLKVNNTVAVTCISTLCTIGSSAPPVYTYTYNITGALVTAHINSLTFGDERTTFACENGMESRSLSPKIKVYPANDTSHMVIQGSLITVKTGCTKLDNGLTFKWYKTPNKDGSEAVSLDEDTNPTIDNTFCIPSDHCEGRGFSSTYTIDHDPNGSPFYMKCIVHVSEDNRQDVILISNSTVYLKDITTTNISPSKTTVTPPSSVSKSSTSEMKTTTTTSRENANSSLSTTLPTTTTSTSAGKVDEKSGLSTGAIVGIVIGAIVIVVIIVVLFVFVFTNMGGKCVGRCKESKT